MSAADLVDDRYSTMVPPRQWGAAVDGQRLAGLSLPHQRTSGGGGGGGEGGSDGDGPERRVLWVGFVCRLNCMQQGLSSLVGLS